MGYSPDNCQLSTVNQFWILDFRLISSINSGVCQVVLDF